MLGWLGLLTISLMTVGINFTIISAFSLLPLTVKNYFGGNAIHLSWVESAMEIGMILGGALLGIWGGFERKILTSMIGWNIGGEIAPLGLMVAGPVADWVGYKPGSISVGCCAFLWARLVYLSPQS